MEKKYYKNLNIIRLLACLGVLLYHLNILKGGYLAVCIFFVLSAYLSCVSAFQQDKFSFASYYKRLFLKTYLPLIIIVFLTIDVISFFPNINWYNMKPETTSILFQYNNFWQLDANLDYFVRTISSPFIHLWYMSILIQFDLIFPFLYLLLRKIGDQTKKMIPCIITIILAFMSYGYFYYSSVTKDIMLAYYNTFSRVFSLLFGLALGFLHCYYPDLISSHRKKNWNHSLIFGIYLFLCIGLFIFIDAKSIYMPISMLLISIVGCRLIDYATINPNEKQFWYDKGIKSLSHISYEVYLFQYPILFLLQEMGITSWIKIPVIILLTVISSYLFAYAIHSHPKNKAFKGIKYLLGILILGVFTYGLYNYFISEDHTKEMKKLEQELLENQKLILEKQEEYQNKIKQEEDDFQEALTKLENGEADLKTLVSNINLVGIGDSVLLGAIPNLYEKFSNGYFDGEVSRTAWVVNDLLLQLKQKNMLGNTIVFNLGTNGDCASCRVEIMKTCQDKDVFWLTAHNGDDPNFNDRIKKFALQYDNLHIIDWDLISQGHNEYFISDGVHLTKAGRVAYANAIYDAIYQLYLERYQKQKEELIQNHEQQEKTKISFYGNDILLNLYHYFPEDFPTTKWNIQEYTYSSLKNQLEKDIQNEELNYKVVFAFDNSIHFNPEEYESFIELCNQHEVYLLAMNQDIISIFHHLSNEHVKIIDFCSKLEKEDFMVDQIHLTEKGNEKLSKLLRENLS